MSKNLAIFLLLLVVALLLWEGFKKPSGEGGNTTRHFHLVTKEKYGGILREIADSMFSPLDAASPNPVAELTRMRATAKADYECGRLEAREADLVLRLCSRLTAMNTVRERFEGEYRSILRREIPSFRGRSGAEQARQYFLSAHLRQWQQTTEQHRSVIASDLYLLRFGERKTEINHATE